MKTWPKAIKMSERGGAIEGEEQKNTGCWPQTLTLLTPIDEQRPGKEPQ